MLLRGTDGENVSVEHPFKVALSAEGPVARSLDTEAGGEKTAT